MVKFSTNIRKKTIPARKKRVEKRLHVTTDKWKAEISKSDNNYWVEIEFYDQNRHMDVYHDVEASGHTIDHVVQVFKMFDDKSLCIAISQKLEDL